MSLLILIGFLAMFFSSTRLIGLSMLTGTFLFQSYPVATVLALAAIAVTYFLYHK